MTVAERLAAWRDLNREILYRCNLFSAVWDPIETAMRSGKPAPTLHAAAALFLYDSIEQLMRHVERTAPGRDEIDGEHRKLFDATDSDYTELLTRSIRFGSLIRELTKTATRDA